MHLDYTSLKALAAVLRSGSFDRAAAELNMTQPAISQRIKSLEEAVGTALIRRGRPSIATKAGARMLRHAEEVGLLEKSLVEDLEGSSPASPVRLAINADSLAVWVLPALAHVSGLAYQITVDDEDHSADWLKSGEVAAAVTSQAKPIPGCDCISLGAIEYRAVCTPEFKSLWFPKGATPEGIRAAPCLNFNAKDKMQSNWVQKTFGQDIPLSGHFLPSTQGFVTAAELGLGWGLNPSHLIDTSLATGRVVEVIPDQTLCVPLFWQISRQTAAPLTPLTRAIRSVARTALIQQK